MARRTNRLSVEFLESRELMAGDIVATIANGNLFLNEARFQSGQANLVQISQLANGNLRVQGLADGTGDRTLVNGAAFRDFTLPAGGGLIATLGFGNDSLFVQRVNRFNTINVDVGHPLANDTDLVNISAGTRTKGEVRIATGGGTDSVFIQDAQVGDGIGLSSENLTIDTGTGADVVNLAGGVSTRANATILTGEGNDQVLVRGTVVGDGKGFTTEDLFIDTAAGADSLHFGSGGESVVVRGNLLATTAFGAEADVDTVQMFQTTVFKTISLQTGAGDDRIALGLVTAGGLMSLSTGDGNDTAKLLEVRAGDLFSIGMGSGDDNLDLTGISARVLSADGGAGFDRLSTFLPGSVGSSNFINWEVINGLTVPLTGGLGLGGGGVLTS